MWSNSLMNFILFWWFSWLNLHTIGSVRSEIFCVPPPPPFSFLNLYVIPYLPKFTCAHMLIRTSTAGNESCPQPQTSEHLAAIEIMKLKHIIILQNKIDLIRDTQARDQYQEILKFVQGGWCTVSQLQCSANSAVSGNLLLFDGAGVCNDVTFVLYLPRACSINHNICCDECAACTCICMLALYV